MKASRRKFIETSMQLGAATLVTSLSAGTLYGATTKSVEKAFFTALQFKQDPLGYAYNALEPSIDAMTMDIHYNKHHAAYVKNVNEAIAAEKINYASEKDFFAHASKLSDKARNNGGGVWNHNFFWKVMAPGKGQAPAGKAGEAISGTFGSFDAFKEQFKKEALGRFGSGWTWLVKDGGKLKIGSTPNQDNPLMDSSTFKGEPLLALDVWEHAYYLKYQNKRNEYIDSWWNVVNWEEVARHI